jgi:hypothetical protein
VTGPPESGKPGPKPDEKVAKMSEYKPGSMDIRAQEKTFAAFIKMITWGAVIVALVLIVLALADH